MVIIPFEFHNLPSDFGIEDSFDKVVVNTIPQFFFYLHNVSKIYSSEHRSLKGKLCCMHVKKCNSNDTGIDIKIYP